MKKCSKLLVRFSNYNITYITIYKSKYIYIYIYTILYSFRDVCNLFCNPPELHKRVCSGSTECV